MTIGNGKSDFFKNPNGCRFCRPKKEIQPKEKKYTKYHIHNIDKKIEEMGCIRLTEKYNHYYLVYSFIDKKVYEFHYKYSIIDRDEESRGKIKVPKNIDKVIRLTDDEIGLFGKFILKDNRHLINIENNDDEFKEVIKQQFEEININEDWEIIGKLHKLRHY